MLLLPMNVKLDGYKGRYNCVEKKIILVYMLPLI